MKLNVFLSLSGRRYHVGILQEIGRRILFEYAENFLHEGIDLSPFQLPLKPGIFEDRGRAFDGLHGVFNDSLPDGWGILLLDRKLRREGLSWEAITPLRRLAMIGKNPMGALEYEPADEDSEAYTEIHLDSLADDVNSFLAGSCDSLLLDRLCSMNGSSAGARPKSIIWLSPDHNMMGHGGNSEELQAKGWTQWMVKFMEKSANRNAGVVEYLYCEAARNCGIDVPPVELFPSKSCSGFFGIQRFDRTSKGKIHTHTACGLLHASHRIPSLDYENLLKLTSILTHSQSQVEEMARRMIFNVVFENRDDHSKNFSFMMDEDHRWKLAPAYDLTPSSGINGEQTSMVNGKGKNITDEDFVEAAKVVAIPDSKIREYAGVIREEWRKFQRDFSK